MPNRILKLIIGTFGASGVALGAIGAHALKAQLVAGGHADVWETAVLYQMIHTVALFALSVQKDTNTQTTNKRPLAVATWCWVCGILFFSGSLYVLALGGPHWLGPITPIGGLAFIVGWGFIAASGLKAPTQPAKS